jgi:hypothetical protein
MSDLKAVGADIEAQIQGWQTKLKEETVRITQMKNAIKTLKNDISVTQSNIDQLNGAIQGSSEILKRFKGEQPAVQEVIVKEKVEKVKK